MTLTPNRQIAEASEASRARIRAELRHPDRVHLVPSPGHLEFLSHALALRAPEIPRLRTDLAENLPTPLRDECAANHMGVPPSAVQNGLQLAHRDREFRAFTVANGTFPLLWITMSPQKSTKRAPMWPSRG